MREQSSIQYVLMAFIMMVFIVLYVWQNISVMKIKMELRADTAGEMELVKINDRLLYEIERFRRLDLVEHYALRTGLKQLGPHNIQTLVVEERNK